MRISTDVIQYKYAACMQIMHEIYAQSVCRKVSSSISKIELSSHLLIDFKGVVSM